jgi:CubicO group peptidase (beta-lactamase class C family)
MKRGSLEVIRWNGLVPRFFMFFFLTLIALPGESQGLRSQTDKLIEKQFSDLSGPGGVFMVARNGKPIYQKTIGMANIELKVPLSVGSVFQIGSMTKQFTAVGVMMLVEQGKLTVQDPISKYISDYPNGDSIFIHHLLTHTSGIKDFTKVPKLKEVSKQDHTPLELIALFRDEPVDFRPGEKFEYNNSGYVLLGYIIEVASGQSYEAFIEENIFRKAGMANSYYATDRNVIPERADGYHQKEGVYVNKTVISYSLPYSSGALMSTLGDMLKWQEALNSQKLFNAATANELFSRKSLNNGVEISYGYGWHLRELGGITSREHGGSIFGYKSMGIYVPEYNLYVLGFTNCDCQSPTQLVKDIALIWLEKFSGRLIARD